MNPTRRRFLAGLSVLAVAPVLAACGSDGSDSGSRPRRPSSAAPEEAAFPVTIKHKYGETTIEKAPKRVVCLGLTDQDALMALGVVPVGVTYWFGDEKLQGVYPWAQEYLGDAELPTVLKDTNGVEIEKVAALAPDLIIGQYAGLTEQDYKKLSAMGVPVVAQNGDYADYGTPWDEAALTLGTADRQAEGRPGAHRHGQEADRRRGRRAPGVQGPDRRGHHAVRGPLPLRPRGPALADAASTSASTCTR